MENNCLSPSLTERHKICRIPTQINLNLKMNTNFTTGPHTTRAESMRKNYLRKESFSNLKKELSK